MTVSWSDDEELMARVSWYYYEEGMTQAEIGEKLGFSRSKVVRLLARARDEGIVKVSITRSACIEKEKRLKDIFDLREAIVVPSADDLEATKHAVGKAAVQYLEKILRNGDVIGVSWGTTVYEVGKQIHFNKFKDLTVIQLIGGMNAGQELNPQEIVKLIASKLGARGLWLNTPAVVESPEIKKALLTESSIRQVIETAKNCRIALLGVGDLGPSSSLLIGGSLSDRDMKMLKALGAVGDVMGCHFDIEGKPVKSELSERIISFALENLRYISIRIGVACGDNKVEPLVGALRGKHINVTITDENTAEKVLNYH